MIGEYFTRHTALASFLRYCLGDAAHIGTMKSERGTVFYFKDDPPGHCKVLADAFFSEQGAAIGNARDLFEVAFELRQTIHKAERNPDGSWEPE